MTDGRRTDPQCSADVASDGGGGVAGSGDDDDQSRVVVVGRLGTI